MAVLDHTGTVGGVQQGAWNSKTKAAGGVRPLSKATGVVVVLLVLTHLALAAGLVAVLVRRPLSARCEFLADDSTTYVVCR